MEINEQKLYVSVNVGASVFPTHGETVEELLKKADIAKTAARNAKKNSYKIYDKSMEGQTEKILFLNNNLPNAISANQFELFYQAQMDIKTNRIIGAEALIRWRHPVRGIISPFEFIGYAEEHGFAIQIYSLVLDMACKQLKIWQDKGLDLNIGVNISPKHFSNGIIVNTINQVLWDKDINLTRLKIELLESSVFEDFNTTIKVIIELKNMGISIALDDFGVGYSSLEYVTKLPIDYLKIDRSFSMQLEENPNNHIILKTIMTLANEMGIQTIVEGVESQPHYDLFRKIGFNIAQGYYINKPMNVADFETLVKQNHREYA